MEGRKSPAYLIFTYSSHLWLMSHKASLQKYEYESEFAVYERAAYLYMQATEIIKPVK